MNTEHDSLQTNERVLDCLQKAKVARKQIVRYVQVRTHIHCISSTISSNYQQLVENEDMIGTLIETNDRIIAALETFDTVCSVSYPLCHQTIHGRYDSYQNLLSRKRMSRKSRTILRRCIFKILNSGNCRRSSEPPCNGH